jgi:cytochrome c-type biogenesis protein CcmE
MKSGKLLGLMLIAACILVAGISLRGSVRQSLTVKEVMASDGEPCEVYGEVVKGSTHSNMQAGRLDFKLQDDKGDTLGVVYNKPKPANFDQATHVKAIGAYRDGAFQADQMILKCPSKYIKKAPAPSKASAATSFFRSVASFFGSVGKGA